MLILFLGISEAKASIALLPDIASIGQNDHVNWLHFGPPGTQISNSSPSIKSFGGLDVSVAMPGLTQFGVYTQSALSEQPLYFPAYGGDFSPGDSVLATGYGDGTGPLTVTFGSHVSSIGFHVNSLFLGPFTVQVQAFDSGGANLRQVFASGSTTSNADGSALFVGLVSTAENIASISVFLTEKPYNGLAQFMAINGIEFYSSESMPGSYPDPAIVEYGGQHAIPEPGVWALLLASMVGFNISFRRRQ